MLYCNDIMIFVSLTNIDKTIFIKQTDVMMDGQRIQEQVNLKIGRVRLNAFLA